ncbi:MAG: hypothetical protein M0P71_00805 [Melioribacteraceae bacterium]|nr:hypothetical protein [Melioribacteraceae bacterium]
MIKIGNFELTPEIRKILSLVMQQEKLSAYALYCQTFKKDPQNGLIEIKELVDSFLLALKDNPEVIQEFIPEKSCSNCIGTCSKRAEKLANGPWTDTDGFVGQDCGMFMGKSEFESLDKRSIKFSTLGIATPTKRLKTIDYCFDGILLMIIMGITKPNGIIKHFIKRFIVNKQNLSNHILKKFENKYFLVENPAKFPVLDSVITVGKISPNIGETFKEYNKRAIALIKLEREKIVNETRKLSHEKAFDELIKLLGKCSEEYFKDSCGGDVSTFMSFLFPDKDVWGALESERRKRI